MRAGRAHDLRFPSRVNSENPRLERTAKRIPEGDCFPMREIASQSREVGFNGEAIAALLNASADIALEIGLGMQTGREGALSLPKRKVPRDDRL